MCFSYFFICRWISNYIYIIPLFRGQSSNGAAVQFSSIQLSTFFKIARISNNTYLYMFHRKCKYGKKFTPTWIALNVCCSGPETRWHMLMREEKSILFNIPFTRNIKLKGRPGSYGTRSQRHYILVIGQVCRYLFSKPTSSDQFYFLANSIVYATFFHSVQFSMPNSKQNIKI